LGAKRRINNPLATPHYLNELAIFEKKLMKVLYYVKWPLILILIGTLGVVFSTLPGRIMSDMENFYTISRWVQVLGLFWMIIMIIMVSNDDKSN